MHDDPYSLSDLCRLADVTPRTVRYYVAQGLLRSPDAAGPSTRYGEGHLARLRVIKRLQREHLPLAEIRNRLERLDDQAVGELLAETTTSEMEATVTAQAEPEDTLTFVRGLLARTGISPSQPSMAAAMPAPASKAAMTAQPAPEPAPDLMRSRGLTLGRRVLRVSEQPLALEAPRVAESRAWLDESPAEAAPATLTGAADRTTWERLSISPDVEIHVRRPLDRLTNKRVEHLARLARELFGEER